MRPNDGLTLQKAVGDPLGYSLAKHQSLRNAINTLVKALDGAGVIELFEGEFQSASTRHRLAIRPQDRDVVINAVLLQGIFSEPKTVIRILTSSADRSEFAQWARELLIERQSIAGLGLIRAELSQFLRLLEDVEVDLSSVRLPDPFVGALPQMGIGPAKATSVLKLIASQAAVLSLGDSMMALYLDGQIEKAYQAAMLVEPNTSLLERYKSLIVKTYKEAKEFDDFLDEWR